MDTYQFTATAHLPDGKTLSTSGTIMECAEWADNIIQTEHVYEIEIRRAQENGDLRKRTP